MKVKIAIKVYFILFLALSLGSCVEPFSLPESATSGNMLVVDGSLNVEKGSGMVRLGRTQQLNANEPVPRISDATVRVETEQGESYLLQPYGNGEYKISGLNLQYNTNYRLLIKLKDGTTYASAFVSTGKTPEIDDVSWEIEQDGVQVYLDTHDPENDTRYYRWEFDETYEFNSGAESEFKYDYATGEVIWREPSARPFICWRTEPSTKIVVGSSVKLNQDVIQNMPISFQPINARALSRRYSINVKQYGISKEEFLYWEMLKKNTENVGSLFDAQPSQVTGNIANTADADEQVFGYFSVNSMTEKRIFISVKDLQDRNMPKYRVEKCELDSISVSDLKRLSPHKLLIHEVWQGMFLWGYKIADKSCADCSVLGGNRNRPDFW